MTLDAMALEILMDGRLSKRGRQAKLTALANRAATLIGSRCPECGSEEVEHNSDSSSFLCTAPNCGHLWDRDEV